MKFEFYDKNSEFILKTLLSGLDLSFMKNSTELKLMQVSLPKNTEIKLQLKENFLLELVKDLKSIPDSDKFILLGDKCLNVELNDSSTNGGISSTYFEIFCRLVKNDSCDEIELLFNDVTRTKILEKTNADFIYKSTFLSKVAHEFKNPLLYISELVNEVEECFNSKTNEFTSNKISSHGNKTKINKIINQIKSMSNFLMVLIKDLDYFSISQLRKGIFIDLKPTDLDSILEFIKEIAKSLILKFSKDKQIKFTLVKRELTSKTISTDEGRLKQILVNLISNAVKFTHFGAINLEVSCNNLNDNGEKEVRFCITDTGIGMSEDFSKCLLNPNMRMSKDGQYGSGLGLLIVSDLSQKLGKKIEFSSQIGKGSSFWFSVPCIKNNNLLTEDIHHHSYIHSQSENDIQFKSESNAHSIISMNQSTHSAKTILKSNLSFNLDRDVRTIYKLRESDEFKTANALQSNLIIINGDGSREPININNNFNINIVNSFSANINNENNEDEGGGYDFSVLIVDDENMNRMTNARLMKQLSKEMKLKCNIVQAEDGVEGLYKIYQGLKSGVYFSCILCDQTMTYMNGTHFADMLKLITEERRMKPIPFYVVTAFEDSNTLSRLAESSYIKKVITKPLGKNHAKDIINEILSFQ
jgi:signal transduction histidine kinase